MNRKNLPLIIVVAVFAGILSLVLSKVLFTTNEDKSQTAEIVQQITTEFNKPPVSVFNEKAINPTQLIKIGDTNNPDAL